MIEQLKQRLIPLIRAKITKYEQRIAEDRQNHLFESDRFYKELNGDSEACGTHRRGKYEFLGRYLEF